MIQPLVAVIVPTTYDRKNFNTNILNTFIRQDYQNKRLFWDYGEGNVGQKRNRLCENSQGDIILHMDSDDMYAPDWITKSVNFLMQKDIHVTGLSTFNLWDIEKNIGYQYRYTNTAIPYLAGATLCYWREYWQRNKFPEIAVAEEIPFIRRTKFLLPHTYIEGFLTTVHSGNTGGRDVNNVRYRRCDEAEELEVQKRFLSIFRIY